MRQKNGTATHGTSSQSASKIGLSLYAGALGLIIRGLASSDARLPYLSHSAILFSGPQAAELLQEGRAGSARAFSISKDPRRHSTFPCLLRRCSVYADGSGLGGPSHGAVPFCLGL